ncbi:MAG: polysaccharide biosynthesis/export family protein [Elusimicrobiota bacterium]
MKSAFLLRSVRKGGFCFFSALALLAAAESRADFSGEGWGARPLGLGGAYIGVADDGYAPFWNPAGMARIKESEAAVSYGKPVGPDGAAGSKGLASFSYIRSGIDMPGTLGLWWAHGADSSVRRDGVFAVSFARDLYFLPYGAKVSGGVTGKFMKRMPLDGSGPADSVFGADVGLMYIPKDRLSVGFSVRNVNGPKLDEDLPLTLGAGVGFWANDRTLLAADVAEVHDSSAEFRAGLERWFKNRTVALRAGADADRLSVGFTLKSIRLAAAALALEYVYGHPFDEGRDDRLHLVTMKAQLGGPRDAVLRSTIASKKGSDRETSRAAAPAWTSVAKATKEPAPKPAKKEDKAAGKKDDDGFEKGDTGATRKIIFIQRKTDLKLGPDDIVEITVKNHPELAAVVKVDSWGYVEVPFAGEVRVGDMTPLEASRQLSNVYSEFVHEPQVMVTVKEYSSRVVYVLGQVRLPGRYPMQDRLMTVRDAIVLAGLPTDRAATWRVFVVRQGEDGVSYKHVNLTRILYRGRLENNLILQSGDILYVPMGFLDTVTTFVGRIVGPIIGIGRAAATSVAAP